MRERFEPAEKTSILTLVAGTLNRLRLVDSKPGLPIVLLTLLSAFCIAFVVYELARGPQQYNDFIVGITSFSGGLKAPDTAGPLTFIAAAVFLFTGLLASRGFIERRLGSAERLEIAILYAFLPVALALGPLLTGGPTAIHPLVVGTTAGLLAVIFAALAALRFPPQSGVDPERVWPAVNASVLMPLFVLALPFAVNVATGKLGGQPVSAAPLEVGVVFAMLTILAIGIVWSLIDAGALSRFRSILLFAQAPLVLFYLVLIPPVFVSPEGTAAQPQAGAMLYLLVGALMLAGLVDLVRRWVDEGSGLSPFALGGLVLCFAVPQNFAPFLLSDDYHFGEYIYPWWALVNFGQLPYVDVTPAHGLVNYFSSALSQVFFGDAVASYSASSTLVAGLLVLSVFVVFTPVLGIGLAWLPALFLALFSPISWIVIAVFLGALTIPALIANRPAWIATWIVCGTLTVLSAPAQGAAIVIATLPAGVLILYWATIKQARTLGALFVVLAVFGIILTLTTPVLSIITGSIVYLLENSSINTIAYGIPWSNTASGTGYEILRMAWLVVPIIGIAVGMRYPNLLRSPLPLLALGSAVILPIAASGYVLGRIDPGAGRLGPAVVWLGLISLPLLLTLTLRQWRMPAVIAAVLVSSALYPRALGADPLATAAQPQVRVAQLTDGLTLGLDDVGQVIADTNHLDRLLRVKARLDQLLGPAETFLDMTGHGADYFYTKRPSPVSITAPFNMPHPDQQVRAIARMMASAPPVALLEASNLNFDGRTSALRAHALYRWAVFKYRPVAFDSYIYGIVPERADALGIRLGDLTAADHTDANWTNGVSLDGARFFLESVTLANMLKVGDVLDFSGSGPRTILGIDGRNIAVDGPLLDPQVDGYPNLIRVPDSIARQVSRETDMELLDRAFRIADLDAVAATWGRSIQSLNAEMTPVFSLDLGGAFLNDLVRGDDGWLRSTGPDPYVVVDVPPLSGAEAGLLVTQFSCRAAARAEMQVFWAGSGSPAFSEAASVSFDAVDGWLIAPLDSQPRWLLSEDINQIRIDMDSVEPCDGVKLDAAYLAQRNSI